MKARVQISIVSSLVILVLLPASVMAQIYPEGMIAYLKFDEGEGNIAHDSISGHHGDISGAAWTDGQVGGALSFPGAGGQVVKMPPSEDWNTGSQITVEAWFNLDRQTYWGQLVGRDGYWCGHGFRGWMLELYTHSDLLTFIVSDGEDHSYSPKWAVRYGEWHHAVGVYDGSFVRLYVDGQEIGSGTPHSAPVPHRDDFYGVTVGNDHLCFPFPIDGKMDEVAIYNRALTPTEIQQHYQNGLNGLGYEVPHNCDSQSQIPETECEALVALFNSTGGSAWSNNTNWLVTDPCDWLGIWCESGSVLQVNLPDNNLVGTIPRELGDLGNLVALNLSGNTLSGPIPAELGGLSGLQYLHLNDNLLTGEIPVELGKLSGLKQLTLHGNHLWGWIPFQLGSLSNLGYLTLHANWLSGTIPPELGNLSNLWYLSLHWNWQLRGSIPPELGNLSNLETLFLSNNQLTGEIPPELGKLSNLKELILSTNQLSGPIPAELGNLSSLEWMTLGANQLSGPIPPELGNLSNLSKHLKLSENQLSGPIPAELGNLSNLRALDLALNQLEGPIPVEIGNLSSLEALHIYVNSLTGEIPAELGNLSNLKDVHLFANQLSGEIPRELGNLSNLEQLHLSDNQLSGSIPRQLGNLSNLVNLWLNINELSGEIPAELGNLGGLQILRLNDNQLSGEVPPELGNLENLVRLTLDNNELSGQVPIRVATLGGSEPLTHDCELMPGNWRLYMPDTQPYLDADLDLDGFICGLALTETAAPRHDPVKEVTNLGTLGGHSIARAINDKGVVVGGSIADDDEMHPFYWTKKDGMQDMGAPHPGLHCEARSIDERDNGAGRCCEILDEWECQDLGERAFLWGYRRGVLFFPYIRANDQCDAAVAFASTGAAFFGGCQEEPWVPMLASRGNPLRFGPLGGIDRDRPSVATSAANPADKTLPTYIAGIFETASGDSHAFLHPRLDGNSGVQDLGTLGGDWSEAWAVNTKGEVVGVSETESGEQHAFLWTEAGGMVDLGTPGGEMSIAWSINDKSQVVGYGEAYSTTVAFLWTQENGMVVLSPIDGSDGWAAFDINNKGIVVGTSGMDDGLRATMWELK